MEGEEGGVEGHGEDERQHERHGADCSRRDEHDPPLPPRLTAQHQPGDDGHEQRHERDSDQELHQPRHVAHVGALAVVQQRRVSLECRVERATDEQVAQDVTRDAVDLGL